MIHIHSWEKVGDTGCTVYKQCRKCLKRSFDQLKQERQNGIIEPLDLSWLVGRSFHLEHERKKYYKSLSKAKEYLQQFA